MREIRFKMDHKICALTPSITQLVKRKSWRQWTHIPGNCYASVLTGRAPLEGSSSSDGGERGNLGSGDSDDDEKPGTGGE